MATYFSFRNVLQAFESGILNPSESDYFVFNCRKERVFPSDGSIPGYVSQMNDKQDHFPNEVTLSPDELHQDTLNLWLQLKPILIKADREGRITWCFNADGERIRDFHSLYHQNHGERLWEVLIILLKPNKPNIVQELSSYDQEILECAKAEVEYEIAKIWVAATTLASIGVVVGYLSVVFLMPVFVMSYLTLLSIFTYILLRNRYRKLSLLSQARIST